MATTSNKAVTETAWTLLFTASGATLGVGIHNFNKHPLMVCVGADPGAGDSSPVGRLWVRGQDSNQNPGTLDLSLDSGDTVYGRLEGGSGNVTVFG